MFSPKYEIWLFFFAFLWIVGCTEKEEVHEQSVVISSGAEDRYVSPDMIQFKDQVTSQELPQVDMLRLKFMTPGGDTVRLNELLHTGKKTILVFMRGFSGSICPYCATQTSRLIANYSQFTDRDAEVVIVYPAESFDDASRLQELQMAAAAQLRSPNLRIPMQMVLDVNLDSVNQLGIRRNLSKPATYIFDSEGKLKFAYVGEGLADRPSVQALVDEIDKIP